VKLNASLSSQYLTALLLIAPRLKGGLQIELEGPLASSGYVTLTKSVMTDFGVEIQRVGTSFRVPESSYRVPEHEYNIEGDWSAAGVWSALNALTGSSINFSNLHLHSEQSDRLFGEVIERFRKPGDITWDALLMPDQVMNLAVLAAFRRGQTIISGAANLRKKECDRLHVLTTELRKAGIAIEEREDGVIVRGRGASSFKLQASSVVLDPHDDHRMAMCFALLGLLRGGIAIIHPECVSKSYPRFFQDLELILRSSKPIAVVGMRGVGKSNFGRRFASKLKLKFIDADRAFEKKYGAIRPFVASRGWEEFRAREEEIVASVLLPGTVVSFGGGAVESAKTRKLIRSRAIGIWIQATETELCKRLKNGKRPPLTKLPLHEEVKMFVQKRTPFYREVSSIEITPRIPFSRQVPVAITKLRSIIQSYDIYTPS